MTGAASTSPEFLELGVVIVGLAVLARVATKLGFSAIPLYLLAGLAFGRGGLAPVSFSQDFVRIGAQIGLLLLLFMLGIEYTGDELSRHLGRALPAGAVDLVLNFPPGFVAGLLLGWKPLAAVLLGGVTWVSSSGIIAKVLAELGRAGNPETATVLSVLVLEDVAMAIYLPIVDVLLSGGTPANIAISAAVAIVAIAAALFIAVRYGHRISDAAGSESDEVILLTTLGAVLLAAGVAERIGVSAAIAAFLVGIAVSGPLARQSHRLLAPLRDLFAATFFFFFGLEIDPASLVSVLPVALVLALVTAASKIGTGWWAAKRAGIDGRGGVRAGVELIPRGEFSIVISGLGAALEPGLAPVSAAYVLLLAVSGPLAARFTK
ncbi:MAG TPA: cation:proton antiporter [Bryobacteraceae bacterium]|nr:cation:proton antiporter [Bryobacteraceae bacterium]